VPAAVITTDAILLRAVAYGEADRIVTLLGKSTGRVSALAKGARKSVKRFGGGLGLGAAGRAALRERSSGDLMALESFEVIEARIGLGGDLARTAHASYAIELCDRLCGPRHPEPAVYEWLDELLARVEGRGATAERLRVFELGLLERLGIGPSLDTCVSCGRGGDDLGDGIARWHPDRGGVVCQPCARHGAVVTAETRRALARLAGLSLEAADGLTLDRDLNAGCRQAIRELLAFHIPGPLKSLEFIDKLSHLKGSAP
jgi:DNA repair protein RecO (recombination protein O)